MRPDIDGYVASDFTPLAAPESFLSEAHPGPAPVCPDEVVVAHRTPVDGLAHTIIDAAREKAGAVPLVDQLRLCETKDLAGHVYELEVRTPAGNLSLGGEAQSVFVQMLAVAEAIALQLDEDRKSVEDENARVALANAEEHVREIRAALELPKFEVGQVWRLVDTREITIQYVLDGRVTARVNRDDEGDGETPSPILEYRVDGVLLDQSIAPQAHTIFHQTPIALLSVLTEQGRVPPVSVPAQRSPEEKWPDDRTVAVGVDEQTQQVVVVPVNRPRKSKKTKTTKSPTKE